MADTVGAVEGSHVGGMGWALWPHRLVALGAIAALFLPTAAHAQATSASADAQKLMEKARSGQPLTPAEQARLRSDMMQQQRQSMHRQLGQMPPKIQALMQKAQSGQSLTPAEKAQIRSWAIQRAMHQMQGGASGHGGPGHATGARGIDFFRELDDATPHENPSVRLGKRHRLTRSGYLRIVRKLRATAAKVIGPQAVRRIDAAVRHHPRKANRLGAVLALTQRALAAQAYAFADAALARPHDALIASNLGVTLYNANAFTAAYDVLGYADALHPKSGVVLSNRAFAAMYLGDLTTASSLFQQAIAHAPKLPDPYVGRALIARAHGDPKRMIVAAGKAIVAGSGSFMAQAMEASAHVHEPEAQRAQDTPIAEMSRSVGGIVLDLHAHSSLHYPTLTVPADYHVAIGLVPVFVKWVEIEKGTVLGLTKTRLAVDKAYAAKQEARAAAMPSNEIMRLSPRILTVLTDLYDVYYARNTLVLKKWQETVRQFVKEDFYTFNRLAKACSHESKYACCVQVTTQGKEFHAAMGEAWAQMQVAQRALMTKYFKESDPYVDGIADPDLQNVYQLNRVFLFRTFLLAGRIGVEDWMAREVKYNAGQCIPPPPPAKKAPNAHDHGKTKKPKPGMCIPPPGQAGLAVINLSWDCNSLTVQGGEGIVLGVKVAFNGVNGQTTQSGHTETTIMAGVGDTLAFGSASLSDSAMFSLTAAQGKVVDAGIQVGAQASASAGIASASLGAQASWTLRGGVSLKPTASASLGGAYGQLNFSN